MWFERYYCAAIEKRFTLTKPQEEEDVGLTQSENELWHLYARDGDHFLVPFQCDICHFKNLINRDPGQTVEDIKLIVTIRRANLDDFWVREPDKVAVTRRKGVRIGKFGNIVGLTKLFPAMEPLPLEDTVGIGIVVYMLQRSLDKEKYKDAL